MRKSRVLIADDEAAIRKFVRANLEVREYETLMATDVSEAC